MRKDKGAKVSPGYSATGKHIFLAAEEDTTVTRGFSRLLLDQLHENCNRTTQLYIAILQRRWQ